MCCSVHTTRGSCPFGPILNPLTWLTDCPVTRWFTYLMFEGTPPEVPGEGEKVLHLQQGGLSPFLSQEPHFIRALILSCLMTTMTIYILGRTKRHQIRIPNQCTGCLHNFKFPASVSYRKLQMWVDIIFFADYNIFEWLLLLYCEKFTIPILLLFLNIAM